MPITQPNGNFQNIDTNPTAQTANIYGPLLRCSKMNGKYLSIIYLFLPIGNCRDLYSNNTSLPFPSPSLPLVYLACILNKSSYNRPTQKKNHKSLTSRNKYSYNTLTQKPSTSRNDCRNVKCPYKCHLRNACQLQRIALTGRKMQTKICFFGEEKCSQRFVSSVQQLELIFNSVRSSCKAYI